MAQFTVRRARTTDDLLVISRLQLDILPSDVPYPIYNAVWWLAFDADGEAIGFAGLAPSVEWSDAVYLCRSGVAEKARGQGVQKRLILVREQHARRMKMRWLITDTHSNPASSNSLIRRGFQMYQPARPWAGATACYWRKDLHR